MRFWEF